MSLGGVAVCSCRAIVEVVHACILVSLWASFSCRAILADVRRVGVLACQALFVVQACLVHVEPSRTHSIARSLTFSQSLISCRARNWSGCGLRAILTSWADSAIHFRCQRVGASSTSYRVGQVLRRTRIPWSAIDTALVCDIRHLTSCAGNWGARLIRALGSIWALLAKALTRFILIEAQLTLCRSLCCRRAHMTDWASCACRCPRQRVVPLWAGHWRQIATFALVACWAFLAIMLTFVFPSGDHWTAACYCTRSHMEGVKASSTSNLALKVQTFETEWTIITLGLTSG